MRAWRPRSARDYGAGVRPQLQLSRTTISEWAIWSSKGAPAKTQFSLALAAQCASNSRGSSPYDRARVPGASGIFWKLPQPSPSSHVAKHGVQGTAPNSIRDDDNHLHIHNSSGGRSFKRDLVIVED